MAKAQMIAVVAGCAIEKGGTYLLVQEKLPKAYGKWNLPAGHVDEGETFEIAAMREAREETGYEVELDRPLTVTHPDTARPVFHPYKAHVIGGNLLIRPDEIMDARWYTLDEVEQLHAEGKLRDVWVINAIREAAV